MTPDQQIAALRASFPGWQIWYVPTVVPPWVWCAKRCDDDNRPPASLINVHSADELTEALTIAERESS